MPLLGYRCTSWLLSSARCNMTYNRYIPVLTHDHHFDPHQVFFCINCHKKSEHPHNCYSNKNISARLHNLRPNDKPTIRYV